VQAPQPQGPRVLVARRALPAGTILTADAVDFQLWPQGMVQDVYYIDGETDMTRLLGTVVRHPVTAGEPVTRGALVAFHTAHKLTLLAHSPAAYRALGARVGGLRKGAIRAEVEAYGAGLMTALKVPATRGRHVNVLQHAAGYLRDRIPAADRKELEESIADFGRGLVPRIVPLTLLRHHVRSEGLEYLAGQVYLDPDPKELMLRNHA
jgi:uncharacterized protein YbgA (DUF1722 family)